MQEEIRALRRRVRIQGFVLCILLMGWLLSATPAISLVGNTVLESFFAEQVPDRSEVLAEWSNRGDRATKVVAQTFSVIRVKEVQIENDAGQVVALLGYDSKGNGGLFIDNAAGDIASFMTVDDAGAGHVGAWGADFSSADLAVNSTGGYVRVLSKTGDVSLGMGTETSTGAGVIGLSHKEGGLVAITARKDGAGLVVQANDGLQGGLSVFQGGTGGLTLGGDEQENPQLKLGVNANGTRELTLGNGGFQAVVDETGKGIAQTRGANNAVIWSSEDTRTGSTPNTGGLLGDLDNDGDVDIQDFLVFVEQFGKSTSG